MLEDTGTDPDQEDTAEDTEPLFREDEALQECAEHIDDTFSAGDSTTTQTLDCCVEVTEAIGYVDLFEYEFQEQCCTLIAENNLFSSSMYPMRDHLFHHRWYRRRKMALSILKFARTITTKVTVESIPHLQQAAIETWKARMVNEYGSARVFEGLYQQLQPLGVIPNDIDRLLDFAADERRHESFVWFSRRSFGGRSHCAGLACCSLFNPSGC